MNMELKEHEPVSGKIFFKKLFAVETRGLCVTEGDFMGGDFLKFNYSGCTQAANCCAQRLCLLFK